MAQEPPVGLVLEQPLYNASDADRPGSLDSPAHILKANGNQSGVPSKLLVRHAIPFRPTFPSRQIGSSRNRRSRETRGFPTKPWADDKPAARCSETRATSAKNAWRSAYHTLRTLIVDHAIEGSRLEPIGQPVAKKINRVGRVGFKAQGISILGL